MIHAPPGGGTSSHAHGESPWAWMPVLSGLRPPPPLLCSGVADVVSSSRSLRSWAWGMGCPVPRHPLASLGDQKACWKEWSRNYGFEFRALIVALPPMLKSMTVAILILDDWKPFSPSSRYVIVTFIYTSSNYSGCSSDLQHINWMKLAVAAENSNLWALCRVRTSIN